MFEPTHMLIEISVEIDQSQRLFDMLEKQLGPLSSEIDLTLSMRPDLPLEDNGTRPPWVQRIFAECHSDDGNYQIKFDALPWFEQAADEDIERLRACGWGGDYPADDVATFMGYRGGLIAEMFDHLAIISDDPAKDDVSGFECHVNEESAIRWLRSNRSELYTRWQSQETEPYNPYRSKGKT